MVTGSSTTLYHFNIQATVNQATAVYNSPSSSLLPAGTLLADAGVFVVPFAAYAGTWECRGGGGWGASSAGTCSGWVCCAISLVSDLSTAAL